MACARAMRFSFFSLLIPALISFDVVFSRSIFTHFACAVLHSLAPAAPFRCSRRCYCPKWCSRIIVSACSSIIFRWVFRMSATMRALCHIVRSFIALVNFSFRRFVLIWMRHLLLWLVLCVTTVAVAASAPTNDILFEFSCFLLVKYFWNVTRFCRFHCCCFYFVCVFFLSRLRYTTISTHSPKNDNLSEFFPLLSRGNLYDYFVRWMLMVEDGIPGAVATAYLVAC